MTYILLKEAGETKNCDSCGCPVPLEQFRERFLCEFCSTSYASRITEYQARDELGYLKQEMWRAAAAVANFLKHGLNK